MRTFLKLLLAICSVVGGVAHGQTATTSLSPAPVDAMKIKTLDAVIDAQSTTPTLIVVPPNYKGADQSFFSNNTFTEDLRFTNGPGFMVFDGNTGIPNQKSHISYTMHAGKNDPYESKGTCCTGPIGISINAFADAGGIPGDSSKANVVPLQIGASQLASSIRPVWGMDVNVGCATLVNSCTGIEDDFGNNNTTSDDTALKGIGFDLIASGRKRSGIGIAVVSSNPPTADWMIASQFSNYRSTGVQISNGELGSTALLLVPPDDTTAVEVQGNNTANNAAAWYITNNGNSNFKTVKSNAFVTDSRNPATAASLRLASVDCIGWRNFANTGDVSLCKNGSDELTVPPVVIGMGTPLVRYARYSIAETPSSVAPNTCTAQSFSNINGVVSADILIGVSKPSEQPGLSVNPGHVIASNTATINYCNNTASPITPTAGETYQFIMVQ